MYIFKNSFRNDAFVSVRNKSLGRYLSRLASFLSHLKSNSVRMKETRASVRLQDITLQAFVAEGAAPLIVKQFYSVF